MKNIIYSKYNSHRAPKYRHRTSFVEEGGKRFVVKTALSGEGMEHLLNMPKNAELLAGAYKRVVPIPCEVIPEGVKYRFIKGEALDKDIDYAKDSLESICEAIRGIFSIIFDFNEGVENRGMVYPANIDPIISNFIRAEGRIYLLDYEWVDEDPAPLNYLKFRSVLWAYREHFGELNPRIEQDEFLKLFGFDRKQITLYHAMENAFQAHVHGRKSKYMYMTNYEKPVKNLAHYIKSSEEQIEELSRDIVAKEGELNGVRALAKYREDIIKNYDFSTRFLLGVLDDYRISLKNPAFALASRKKSKNAKRELDRLRAEEAAMGAEIAEMKADLLGGYEFWIKKQEAKEKYDREFSYRPLISVLVPVYNVPENMLSECIESVRAQVYDNWELILVDDGSTLESVRPALEAAAASDERIRAYFCKENGGISSASNVALSHAKGEFIALLDCDDTLSINALYENICMLNEDSTLDLVYSDEDKIDEEGNERQLPNFKPEFSPDTLLSVNYICHLAVYRKSIVDEVGGFRSEYDGAQDYDLVLRVTEKTDRIAHISKVLYHWRMRKGSTAESEEAKPYSVDVTMKLKKEALARRGIDARVEQIPGQYLSRVVYEVKDEPLVSIIIPSKDHPYILEKCLSTLLRYTLYREYEVIVIDNGSSPENRAYYEYSCAKHDARYEYEPMEFNFSRMCNIGASLARGEYLLFLNDDMEIIDRHWLSIMLGTAQQEHIGAVGAKLYFPGARYIQHAGVVNTKSGPGHVLIRSDDTLTHAYYRNILDFDVIAVTGACLMIDRKKYEQVGGFDESFAVNYNDVDFCFNLYEAGYYNVIRNDARLIHHESLSRGEGLLEKDKLFRERNRLYRHHPKMDGGKDPFYNINQNQYAPSFGIDQDRDTVFSCEKAPEGVVDGNPREFDSDIELVIVDWAVHILGWAAFLTDNDLRPVSLLIKREEDGAEFVMSTRKMVVEHLTKRHSDLPFAALSGFRTMTDRRFVEDGTYRLYVLRDNVKYDTKKKIFIGTVNPDPNSKEVVADVIEN